MYKNGETIFNELNELINKKILYYPLLKHLEI